jgi:hypothetical protein
LNPHDDDDDDDDDAFVCVDGDCAYERLRCV